MSNIDFIVESIKASNNDKPFSKPNANYYNPCGICSKNVNNNQRAIKCVKCKFKIHLKCNEISDEDYKRIGESCSSSLSLLAKDWSCLRCLVISNSELFPFGLESNFELKIMNQMNSFSLQEKIPTFSITAEINKIDNLSPADIDQHLSDKVNSKSYSVDEINNNFVNSNKSSSFSVFHSNVNGLDTHYHDLHLLLSEINIDFSVINITETSQKLNQNFKTNVSLQGYASPFTTETKSNKGGVAIYVKNNLEVFERCDLKISDIEYQAVWI